MARELEYKYRADPESLEAIRREFSGFREIAMENTYYDTQDLKLSLHHWTLRRRLENGREVYTVKIPLADGSRGEWETEAPSLMDAVMALCRSGAPWELMRCCAGGVYPLCGARFTRLAAWIDLGDVQVELALDQGVLTGRGKTLPFREVEAEYLSGSEEAAAAFARTLADRFRLTEEPLSKFARARALALTE